MRSATSELKIGTTLEEGMTAVSKKQGGGLKHRWQRQEVITENEKQENEKKRNKEKREDMRASI